MRNVPMTRPEEALAVHAPTVMAPSTFVELQDGRVLAAGHTGEGATSSFTVSDDGGLTWSDPVPRSDKNEDPIQAGGLVNLSGNGIGAAGVAGWATTESRLLFWRSEDGGETWDAPIEITPDGRGVYIYQDMLLRTSSGRIILPTYGGLGRRPRPDETPMAKAGKLVNNEFRSTPAHYFDPLFSYVDSYYSDDDGRTWTRCPDGEMVIMMDPNATVSYVNEPTVCEVAPGTLLMMLRTGLNRLFQAWSYDNGETWTRPMPTSLASSTAPAQIGLLPTGHLLCVWNQQSEEEILRGYGRTRMSAAISRNGGSVWEFFQNLDSLWEETRVEPGPVKRGGPAEYYYEPGVGAPERDPANVTMASEYAYWTYPSMLILKDRVIIKYADGNLSNGVIKVLPISWFYGGKEPADNPFLENPYAPASP
jgi:hypothetical protein